MQTSTKAAVATIPTGDIVRVARVVDGDTIDVILGGKVEPIRIIGIDTPEVVDQRKPVQCFGREASAKARDLLDGQSVRLSADPTQDNRDKYDRLLRYVDKADGTDFGLRMIANGFAHEYTYRIPYQRQAPYKTAYATAREKNLGLWSPTTCSGNTKQAADKPAATSVPAPVVPTKAAAPAPAIAPTAQAGTRAICDPAYPDVCIKPPPPDLDCKDVPYRQFRVLAPDPHRFDGNKDGVGCEN